MEFIFALFGVVLLAIGGLYYMAKKNKESILAYVESLLKKHTATVVAAVANASPKSSAPLVAPVGQYAPAFSPDAQGFLSVGQFGTAITQPTVIANQRLCTVLALPTLTDPAAIARVKLNCAAATMANASRAAIPDSFSWHNTAWDVKSDGKGGFMLDTSIAAILKNNTVIPDTAATESDVVAYANTLPIFTEQWPQPKVL